MPFFSLDRHTRLFYRLEGREDLPVLVLSHSLGVDHGQWDAQVADLLPHFRILRYDLRGHGASGPNYQTNPSSQLPLSMEQLGRDVLALADTLGIARFAFCGLSLGGMIGQWLGAHAGERLTHLVLANTSPHYSDPTIMELRRAAVLAGGMEAIAGAVMGRFFSAETLAANPPHVASTRHTLLQTNPQGYAACCEAIRDMDQRELLATIRTPVLVIVGDQDLSTPWQGPGEALVHGIPGAIVEHLPAAHLSNIERPRSFTMALLHFLLERPADPLQAGSAVRRRALGDAHVDRSTASATPFNRDFQQFITSYAWGAIWTRPGFDQRTRRLQVLAVLVALGRWEEFRMHVRSGLAAELEPCDLKELLMQVAIYGGVPVANTGFHIAMEELTVRETGKS